MRKIETKLPIMILTYKFTKEELPVVNRLCNLIDVQENFTIQIKGEITENDAEFYNIEFFSSIPAYGNWHFEMGIGLIIDQLTEPIISNLLFNNICCENMTFTSPIGDLDILQGISPAELLEIETEIINPSSPTKLIKYN